ncbi:hypothetical protein A3Q56_04815, partial [Intoshia linei]
MKILEKLEKWKKGRKEKNNVVTENELRSIINDDNS